MRHVYLDEAGVGDEPFTVVAGLMLHVDDQYRDFQRRLLSMARELLGKEHTQDFVFHAKDLWHGSGFFPRGTWSREKRLKTLSRLAELPGEFGSPVVYAAVSKEEVPSRLGDPKTRLRLRHQLAFHYALEEAEKGLERHYPDELAFLIVEDHPNHRKHLTWVYSMLYDRHFHFRLENMGLSSPFQRLVESPLFQAKNGASPVQVADVCAFLIRRCLEGCPTARQIAEQFTPQLVSGWRTNFVQWARVSLGDT